MAVDNYYYIPTTVLKIQFIRYKEWTNSRRQPTLRSSVVQLHKEGARLDLGPRAPTRPPSCSSSSLSCSSLQSFRRWKCFVSLWRQIWGLNSCQILVFEYAELLCCFFLPNLTSRKHKLSRHPISIFVCREEFSPVASYLFCHGKFPLKLHTFN